MTPAILFHPPPPELDLAANEIHVFCASLDQPQSRIQRLAAMLSEDERARAARFRLSTDRERFVTGRGMLREILGWILHEEPARLTFSYSARGKPHIATPPAGRTISFNLAHSDRLVAYAVARGRDVGVDLERIRPIDQTEQIATHFFSEQEAAHWRSFPAGQRTEAFYSAWTRMEARCKAIGDGISESTGHVGISGARDEPRQEFRAAGVLRAGAQWSHLSLTPALGFVGAVAFRGRATRLACWKWPR